MSNVARSLVFVPLLALAACSSDSKSAGTADAAPGAGGSSSAGGATSTSSGGSQSAAGASASSGGSSSGTGGASASGGAGQQGSDAAADASPACKTYCTCMATNCADKTFAGGCLEACATQTKWDLTCRQTMCTLAPQQPDNDHCTHAAGVVECPDKT